MNVKWVQWFSQYVLSSTKWLLWLKPCCCCHAIGVRIDEEYQKGLLKIWIGSLYEKRNKHFPTVLFAVLTELFYMSQSLFYVCVNQFLVIARRTLPLALEKVCTCLIVIEMQVKQPTFRIFRVKHSQSPNRWVTYERLLNLVQFYHRLF